MKFALSLKQQTIPIFDQRCPDANFVSFLFYYYCTHLGFEDHF